MRRTLKIRNRSVEVSTMDSLVALRQASRAQARADQFAALVMASPPPSHDGVTTFLQAGWHFGQPREGLLAAARSGASLPGVDAVREVSLMPSGRMVATGDTLTVKLSQSFDPEEAPVQLMQDGLTILRRLPFENVWEVRTTQAESALDAAIRLSDSKHYAFAEPQFDEVIGNRWRPNDPDYGRQWQWMNSGAGGGKVGADAHLEAAWNTTRGLRPDGTRVRIAVIDNGIEAAHPDLVQSIAHGGHYEEDGTGSTTFVPYSGTGSFPNGDHGTFCAGMAVARANNGVGGCGAAPESSFIPVACLLDQVGSQATLARALAYAAVPSNEEPQRPNTEGADVITCSLGPNGPDWEMLTVLELAINLVVTKGRSGKGTPIFWAVSNGHFPISRDEVVSHPSVIKVGRSSRMDLDDGSAFGPELDFLAPGVAVFSTRSGGGHGANTGTSFAAPLAAGIGSLMLANDPNLTWSDVRTRMRASCDKIGPKLYTNDRNDDCGYGRVNAERCL